MKPSKMTNEKLADNLTSIVPFLTRAARDVTDSEDIIKESAKRLRRPTAKVITFYGYAVKKDGKYLGFNPKRDKFGKLRKKQYYERPKFPVVNGERSAQEEANGNLGEVVKVKLTMEEVK